jgi:hypothetical protein
MNLVHKFLKEKGNGHLEFHTNTKNDNNKKWVMVYILIPTQNHQTNK